MAKYPIRITLSPSKPSAPKPAPKPMAKPAPKPMAKPAQNRAAPLVTQGRLDRNARTQGEMDHMRSILAHAASRATPVRMPTPNVDNMVKGPSTGPFSGKGTPARMPSMTKKVK